VTITKTAKQKLFLGFILFIITFIVLGFSVRELWFREDDLGTIVNGLIRNWNDFVRVFSSDCRSFIVPVNYRRTEPNFISGFLRPMQNVFFTVIYYLWDFNPHAYYLAHVGLHALNSVLLFYLCSLFIPVSLSVLAGFLFAFYPNVSWLPWIGTMQNSLSTLFLLASVLLFYKFLVRSNLSAGPEVSKDRSALVVLFSSGIFYFLSLLSRENGLMIPFWLFLGVYLLYPQENPEQSQSCWQRLKISLNYTLVFFIANIMFVVMRMWAFGFGTLGRTYNNLFIRFPWLVKWVKLFNHAPEQGVQKVTQVTQNIVANTPDISSPISSVTQSTQAQVSWFDTVSIKLQALSKYLLSWLGTLFELPASNLLEQSLIYGLGLLFLIFFLIAYREHKKLLLWLTFGLCCGLWPGILAYPCSRYINLAYPFFIVMIVVGMYLLALSAQQKTALALRSESMKWTSVSKGAPVMFLISCVWIISCLAVIKGAYQNSYELRSVSHGAWEHNKRFEKFFKSHIFDKKVKVILLGSPFVSDIQNIFQVGFNNLHMPVAFELFSTFAEKNSFGCMGDYQIRHVPSKFIKIPDGFRFISGDKEHCAMWMQFSDHPVRFNPEHRAYEWTQDKYEIDRWYQSSMGKFMIHELLDGKYVTDISFIFDPVWIDENTVFVTWDTLLGEYKLLETD